MKRTWIYLRSLILAISTIVAAPHIYQASLVQSLDLWHSIASGDVDSIDKFAKWGGDLNAQSWKHGKIPLIYAMDCKNKESYLRLLQRGANPNCVGRRSNRRLASPVVIASESSDPFWLLAALKHGANSNNPPARNIFLSPLQAAAGEGILENVRILCDSGADIDPEDHPRLIPPLEAAAQTGKWNCALELLRRGANYNRELPVNAKWRTFSQSVSYHFPMNYLRDPDKKDAIDAVRIYLASKGVDPNLKFPKNRSWEFVPRDPNDIWSVIERNDVKELARYISGSHLILDSVSHGRSPLMYSIQMLRFDSFRLLLEHGADPNALYDGVNVVNCAAGLPDIAWLELSMKFGGNVRFRDDIESHLFKAIEGGVENVKLLCDYGADLNYHLADNTTALAAAASVCQYDCVYELLNRGAEFNYKVPTGSSLDGHDTFIGILKAQLRNDPNGAKCTQVELRNRVVSWLKTKGIDVPQCYWVECEWHCNQKE